MLAWRKSLLRPWPPLSRPVSGVRQLGHLCILPTDESLVATHCALGRANLRQSITSVEIHTTLEHIAPVGSYPYRQSHIDSWQREHADLPRHFLPAIRCLGQFENLESVSLNYALGCVSDTTDLPYVDPVSPHVIERENNRHAVLAALFAGLNHKEHPAKNVHTLSIKNLQNIAKEEIMTSSDCKAVLFRLRSLYLQITTEQIILYHEHKINDLPEAHQFYGTDLKKYWLQPLQSRLESLQIYAAESYWGYFPPCDLRDLHFSALKRLMLGNMTFTHGWQLDWILEHKRTLESLVLDDCPILHFCSMFGRFGADRAAPAPQNRDSEDEISGWLYSERWSEYYARIREGLPNLRHFGCGFGPWTSQKAFEEAGSLSAELVPQRYIIFDGGTCPSHWIWPRAAYTNSSSSRIEVMDNNHQSAESLAGASMERRFEQYDCCFEDHPPYPDSDECDGLELHALKQQIAERNADLDRT